MATSLRSLQSKLSSLDWPTTKTVISNRILVISRRNAFYQVYAFTAILVPKLVSMVTPLCPLCTSVTDEFPDSTNPISKPNSALYLWLRTEVMAIFVIFLPILAKIWLPWQRPLDSRNQKCLIWISQPLKLYPKTKNFVNSCYRSEVLLIRRFATSLALWE